MEGRQPQQVVSCTTYLYTELIHRASTADFRDVLWRWTDWEWCLRL